MHAPTLWRGQRLTATVSGHLTNKDAGREREDSARTDQLGHQRRE